MRPGGEALLHELGLKGVEMDATVPIADCSRPITPSRSTKVFRAAVEMVVNRRYPTAGAHGKAGVFLAPSSHPDEGR
jgi:hypothetical protein